MKSKSGYAILPEVYDRWQKSYGKDFSTLILPKVLRTIKDHKIPRGTMVDLACGTGTLALMMARRKWTVAGVDVSEGMLRAARVKAKAAGLQIPFLRQDMRGFTISHPVDLVTCLFDSVNHIASPVDLARCFRKVHSVLVPGGFFIFDVNNLLCFKTVWRHDAIMHEPEFSISLENSFNMQRRKAVCVATVFVKRGKRYEKLSETVHERYYPRDEIGDLLSRTGFEVVDCHDFNFTPDPMVGDIKTWWVAQRKR